MKTDGFVAMAAEEIWIVIKVLLSFFFILIAKYLEAERIFAHIT